MNKQTLPSIARDLLPPVVYRTIRPVFRMFRPLLHENRPGHHGDYATFNEAIAACGTAGGAEPNVVETVAVWTRPLRDDASSGRLVPLDGRSLQNLSALLYATYGERRDVVEILDFGGALGGLYYQLGRYVPRRQKLQWVVCEMPIMAEMGRREFATDELTFVSDLGALGNRKVDVVVASGSLQCVEDPHGVLRALSSLSDSLILNRVPLFASPRDRLTVHHVNPNIYTARVPNWFFSEARWLEQCRELGFEVTLRWEVPQDTMLLDGQAIVFTGMLLQRNRRG